MYIQNPNFPQYIGKRVASFGMEAGSGTYIVGGILDTAFGCSGTLPCFFVGFVVVLYLQKMRFWLEMIRTKLQRNGLSIIGIKQYRLMQTINKIAYTCIGQLLLPSVYFTFYCITLSLWTTIIKSSKSMTIGIFFNFGFFAIFDVYGMDLLVKAGGCVLEYSQSIQICLKRSQNPLMRRYLRSCNDVRVYVGPVFYSDKSSFTVCLNSIINNMITIILAF